jgi:Na+/H+ antiporter
MVSTIQTLLLMLGVLVAVAATAQRLSVPPAMLMLVAGIAIALVPGLPTLQLAPQLVLLVVLPPLIYSAAVAMSWREFRFNLRPIALLAFGGVVFTTCMVALAAHYILGLPWAIGFLLGAIVAPPDVVAPLSIARRIGLPQRILVVLEGEGLVNDATALVIYRFAVAAIATGAFSLVHAVSTFALIVVGELAYGIAVGWLSLRLRQWAHNTHVEITLSLMTPYIAYWLPEHLGGSGVLATVATGLYVSWNGPLLISSTTRLQGIFFWDLIIYWITGLVFLFTGLQMRTLLERVYPSEIFRMVVATLVTTAIVIVARFVWLFPSTYVPRWLSPKLAQRDPSPPWQGPFMISVIGVRGVVSLTAALAVPLTTNDGQRFPSRDLILFVTFGVIIITLVGTSFLLPSLVDRLGLASTASEEQRRAREQEQAARALTLEAAERRLDTLAAERSLPDEVVKLVHTRHDDQRQQLPKDLDDGLALTRSSVELRRELIGEQRKLIHQLLRDGKLDDESRRRIERDLDLEEESIGSKDSTETPL